MGAIRLVTEVPGPKSREILQRHERYVARALAPGFPAVIRAARGALLEDVDGNTFIDLAGGVGVMNVGHSDPDVLAAARKQLECFVHTDYTVAPYAAYSELAGRLVELVPGAEKAAFFNTGAEAVENAVKIARSYTGRKAVIAFEGAFHGRTWMALALTSKTRPYKQGFLPLAGEVYRVPYANPYRPPVVWRSGRSFGEACAALLDGIFAEHVAAEDVAALIVEPVQGEGGFVVPPEDYLPALKRRCEEHGIVFIADEVQTGFGRTGRMFAVEHSGVEPDLVVVAKSIAAGFPLSGVLGKAEIMDAPVEGAMGGTYPGNPVALAGALAVLERFESGELLERSERIGETVRRRFGELAGEVEMIGDVRGLGAMSAVEFVRDRETKEPAGEEVSRMLRLAAERGVLALPAGLKGNCIRFLSPLVITDEQLHEALEVLEGCVREVAAGASPEERSAADSLANPI
ncbi:4-aminobutyrate--2-oxoglutarate transaminase [Rubrobacter taiwanensis]|jgi:4-aminobutyrate aminotransferase/(S)-3-amino-2-methylpropionate transaminase|uniref:(S)-3-amino-2-methylpropionate transaminase n=1 Tax=Rubrobacter taiwanensis TaxID=185139 RepID=A0A4R1BHR5_9ACTN|nr:4-aminobutyrate--2-oxoglutarate transaminase [Rubrobacter taiwanensis]TCJ16779.1 4-aminobutyrate--2-oxoglutarate transaminase [Rubrobacter taiwanensis]